MIKWENKRAEWEHHHGREVLFVKKLKERFSCDDIDEILEAIDSVCPDCFDKEGPCYCMRED